MNTKNYASNNSASIYPGVYRSVFIDDEKVINRLKRQEEQSNPTSIQTIEYDDFFILELVAPGYKKEEICVLINNYELAVCILKQEVLIENADYPTQKSESCPYFEIIALPSYIDTYFITSFYEHGVLKIYCPKTIYTFKKIRGRVPVY